MIHQIRADRPSRTTDEDTTPTIESCASATPTRRHSRRSGENTWCRGWESNPHRPEARGILRPREKGGEQRTWPRRVVESEGYVGVGTPLAGHPLHRSGRAVLPHPAPTLGDDAEPHERVRVADARGRQPSGDQTLHPGPRHAVALTAPPQSATPEPADGASERPQGRAVQGHAVVPDVTRHDRAQVGALLRNGIVQAPLEFGLHRLQLRPPPRAHRLPQHRELSRPGLRAAVREAQEGEGLRLAPATLAPVRVGEPPELDEARPRKRSASSRCSNPTAKSSAKRTTTTSPRACFFLHRWTQRSNT